MLTVESIKRAEEFTYDWEAQWRQIEGAIVQTQGLAIYREAYMAALHHVSPRLAREYGLEAAQDLHSESYEMAVAVRLLIGWLSRRTI
jgi:hypothetical protein